MPIVISEYDPRWPEQFAVEELALAKVFGGAALHIHHIGSTSVPRLAAKPIIDILVEITSLNACDAHNEGMRSLGYEVMGSYGIEGRRYFRKMSSEGVRTHHVHAFAKGSPHIVRHLAFRDYLIAHPDKVRAYETIKRRAAERTRSDCDSYMDGKEAFVLETERLALRWAGASSKANRLQAGTGIGTMHLFRR